MTCPNHTMVTRHGNTFCPECGEHGDPVQRIDTQAQLIALAKRLRVGPDWHEPDEQEVTAAVYGTTFDNAGFWPIDPKRLSDDELYVELSQDGVPVAQVNLASLFAMACGNPMNL